ncbi:hypothetical protein FRB94_000343 [Tulasnella sp. JGI-2019a]|nr:hypothetical protein FRB93_006658 [Tulasnella sp. JGI-2019a]KAG9006838.1 hypothetical protein FRB94_000343 [Tulasnella sp. JGI-2019a]KAG9028730.1 hypothetical protein FRB95_006135 [Tulasnella sp. JGI-2019a]
MSSYMYTVETLDIPSSPEDETGDASFDTAFEDALEDQPVDEDVESLDAENRIEVQAFLERKTWIQDKIKLLESMPPIDVFQSVELILPTTPGVPIEGLPTHEEVVAWVAEHDRIEAETEQFDKGDMIRLKKFAKAKSEQSLSPEDTDLIELTLETLFALDKLIHLLRVRADNLEQIDLRLKWEDLRVGAWRERKALLEDISRFVKTKARWSSAVYDELTNQVPTGTTPPANNVGESPASAKFLSLSRTARYKHAELLSREAAAFSTRLLNFHNSWISPSGHILDKLIEKRTVPDQLLDEQDRLEDQSKVLDGVSKFPMQLVAQWKKADEIYGELKKDQITGRALFAELQKALQAHPRVRMDEEFMSRSSALNSRLSQLSDPVTSRTFPRPLNPGYPDQKQNNEALASLLSTELRTAIRSAKQASAAVKQYHASSEAVQSVRKLNGEMAILIADFVALHERLTKGPNVTPNGGDGSPPSIETAVCLDPLRHATFLALLPTVSAELSTRRKDADRTISATRASMLSLEGAVLEKDFRPDTESLINRLEVARESALEAAQDVEKRAELMRNTRSISEAIQRAAQDLTSMRERVLQVIDRQKWKAERGRDGAPLTPDSPTFGAPEPDLLVEDALSFGQQLSKAVADNVATPCTTLLPMLGVPLADHIRRSYESLSASVELYKELVQFWQDVRRQANAMREVRDQTHELEGRMDDLRRALQEARGLILEGDGSSTDHVTPLAGNVADVRQSVERFQSGLTARIPFVARSASRGPAIHSLRPSAMEHLSFNASTLDHAVKTDVNAFSASLASSLDSVIRNLDILRLAGMAKVVDQDVSHTNDEIRRVEERVAVLGASLAKLDPADDLQHWQEGLERIREEFSSTIGDGQSRLRGLFMSAAKSLAALESAPGVQDLTANETIIVPRRRAVSEAARRSEALVPKLQALQEDISIRLEGVRLGRQLDLALLAMNEELRCANEAADNEQARLHDVALERPDAHAVLTDILNRLDATVNDYRGGMAVAVPALKKSRTSVQASPSFRDATIFTLLRPKVDEAVRLEGFDKSLEPLIAQLQTQTSEKLELIEATLEMDRQVNAGRRDMGTTREKLVDLSSRYRGMTGQVSEDVLHALSSDVSQLQDAHDTKITSAVGRLQKSLAALQHLKASREPTASNIVNLSVQNVDNIASAQLDLHSRLTGFTGELKNHISLNRQGNIVDDKIESATQSLDDARSRLQEITAGFDIVIASLDKQSTNTDTSTTEQLQDLRTRSISLQKVLERSVAPLLDDARHAADDLQARADGIEIGLRATIVALREIKVKDLNHAYLKCVEDLNSLSANIVEAEATEFARIQTQRNKREQAENERLRLEHEEKERLEAMAVAAREAEMERRRQEAEEKMRQMEEDTAKREEAERLARVSAEAEARKVADELARMREAEQQRLRMEEETLRERARLMETKDCGTGTDDEASKLDELDVFGLRAAPSSRHKRTISKEEIDLHGRIVSLRSQLRSLSLHSLLRPTGVQTPSKSSVLEPLPSESRVADIKEKYCAIVDTTASLPSRIDDPVQQAERKSLEFEVEASMPLVERLERLGRFATVVTEADNALSDLLEHVDSYPLPPPETVSSHQSDSNSSPQEQLSSRVGFTGASMDEMKGAADGIVDDRRVATEKERLEQMWGELWDMSMDKINNLRSRPGSVRPPPSDTGSQSASGADQIPGSVAAARRSRAFSSMSVSGNNGSRPSSVVGPVDRSRPRVVGPGVLGSRSSSRISNRSVSGPVASGSKKNITVPIPSSVSQRSTFASRQRTSSTSSMASNGPPSPLKASMSRSRLLSGQGVPMSPAIAESGTPPGARPLPTYGRTPRSSLSTPSGAGASSRAPRTSISSRTPLNVPKKARRQYIPNDKHRVDVAVAKVVNDLDPDYDVSIEPVSWKDQSGKYWIGDKDPKLCFCRILRSQTVMVRVGGGWLELSKFLKGHYEAFRIQPPPMIPGSPPREEEERWISSASLLAAEGSSPSISLAEEDSPPKPPVTPEPRRGSRASLTPHDPSQYLPGRSSPLTKSILGSHSPLYSTTGSSPHASGSPLTPLQFLRRADDAHPPLPPRPTTPTHPKLSTSTSKIGKTTPNASRRKSLAPPVAPTVARWRP